MTLRTIATAATALLVVAAIGALVAWRLLAPQAAAPRPQSRMEIPVEVAPVVVGPIEDARVFSASLEARARVTIAAKVSGLVTSLPLDLADQVERGQIVARLDDAESAQSVAQAQAELAVAQADVVDARNALEIAQRELDRTTELNDQGIATDTELDTARAAQLAASAAHEVAKANIQRVESLLESARIRQSYTTIRADWEGTNDTRVVANRYVEEGETVSANQPIIAIIDLDPVVAAFTVTERDYARMRVGQSVTLTTDAYPNRSWTGAIERIAPAFDEGSRQARVEVRVENTDEALRPGMFARVRAVLATVEQTTIIEQRAIVNRGGQDVVFVIDDAVTPPVARAVPVRVGIIQGTRAQATTLDDTEPLRGRVVTLGQQLLDDGSPVTIPAERDQ
jgi:RND family efflux transporter MFP subunit